MVRDLHPLQELDVQKPIRLNSRYFCFWPLHLYYCGFIFALFIFDDVTKVFGDVTIKMYFH